MADQNTNIILWIVLTVVILATIYGILNTFFPAVFNKAFGDVDSLLDTAEF